MITVKGSVEQVWADEDSVEYEAYAQGMTGLGRSYLGALASLEKKLAAKYGEPVRVEDMHDPGV